ncbi:MAG: CotH kinase family protein [Flavobacteriales bacterium]|nr:CotH kinase family protein [Flavobacteriales bacterium]
MISTQRNAAPVLLMALVGCAFLAMAIGRAPRPARSKESGAPLILPANARASEGTVITIRAQQGDHLWYTTNGDGSDPRYGDDHITLNAAPDMRAVSAVLSTPTAVQWRHPLFGLPGAMVVRAGGSARGPLVMRTYLFADHGVLPVISISALNEDLFDPEKGIAVVGDGMLYADEDVLNAYATDPKWWRYPGNYHGRGKEWERPARMQLIAADGNEVFQCDVDLRINGYNTRGFPQHAFRLLFREPLSVAPFPDGDGIGSEALILRAAGNDQVKAMMRDAYQHALCEGAPFETSKALTCVVYVNGAYNGVHHLRQRMDEKELARRHGIKTSQITLLENSSVLAHGDEEDAQVFGRIVGQTERWNGSDGGWLDTLEARVDVDGFLAYMAGQMILGNMDWPKQNLKYWRYTGTPRDQQPLDGKWHFIMGDSDLGFGANAPASSDMFARVRDTNAPIARLFLSMMRSPVLKARFLAQAGLLLEGPLSPARCGAVLEDFVTRMGPEMDRHTARWRKPLDKRTWSVEVEVMRRFAQERAGHVRQQLDRFRSE